MWDLAAWRAIPAGAYRVGALLGVLLVGQAVMRWSPLSVAHSLPAVAALLGLIPALRRDAEPAGAERTPPATVPIRRESLAMCVLLVALAGTIMASRPPSAALWDVAVLWGGAMLVYPFALGAALRAPTRAELTAVVRNPEVRVVLGLVVAAALLRVVRLEEVPRHLHGEEGEFGFIAMDTRHGQPPHPFGTGWFTHPVLPFFLQGLSMALWGDTIFGLRFVSAVGGTAGVLATYLWARGLFGAPVGLGAGVLLAAFHTHIYFSRTALQVAQSWLSLFLPLTLWLVDHGLARGRWWALGLAGVSAGLAQYWYFAGRVIPILAIGALLYTARRSHTRIWRPLAIFGFGMLISALPLGIGYARAPAAYLDRVHGVLTNTPDAVTEVARERGEPLITVLPGHIMQTMLAYHQVPARDPYMQSEEPYLDPLSAALMLVGVAVCALRWREARYLVLLLTLLFIMGSVSLTELPPATQRLFINSVPVCVLTALGAWTATRLVAGRGSQSEVRARRATAVLVGLIAGVTIWQLFCQYLPQGRDADQNSAVAAELGYLLRAEGRPVKYYVFFEPRMTATSHHSTRFIAREAQGVNVPPLPTPGPAFEVGPERTLFVALPHRLDELRALEAQYPGGAEVAVRDAEGQDAFYVYRPPSSP